MRLLENLTILMKKNGINRTQLAKEIGVAPSTVNSWFNRNCDNITLSTLLKLSKYFSITMEELINGVPNINNITFNCIEFSANELEIIKKFSEFLKDNRDINILPLSDIPRKTTKKEA